MKTFNLIKVYMKMVGAEENSVKTALTKVCKSPWGNTLWEKRKLILLQVNAQTLYVKQCIIYKYYNLIEYYYY